MHNVFIHGGQYIASYQSVEQAVSDAVMWIEKWFSGFQVFRFSYHNLQSIATVMRARAETPTFVQV